MNTKLNIHELVPIDVNDYKDVWVLAEQRAGVIMPNVLELLNEGRKLADDLEVDLVAVIAGGSVKSQSETLIHHGADKVIVIESPLLEEYTTDAYTKVLYDAILKYKPEIILIGATAIGRDLGPRLASRLNTGLTADCTKLEIDKEKRQIRQTRPAFGGNLMATIITPDNRPQMSTVRPGVFLKALEKPERTGEVIMEKPELKASDIRTTVKQVVKHTKKIVDLPSAQIIVSGGRGLGNAEGFKLIEEFAEVAGGVVGASRAAVDSGWISQDHQVGQTGTSVRPTIYFACGISGAIQHLAGMQESDCIVAINKNADAPIMRIADYAVVGDLYKLIPMFIEEFKKDPDNKNN
ncbi:MAG: electron transfer flavoprotein subunit alpha/FixB family protein [Fastidiosipilaceae bacterium]|jgi:electron transfer flavoprotein alpha subunit|nr:electron transfer flavoprotein subunit alpha/FixB family protein [Clostridiaceae bacterium]